MLRTLHVGNAPDPHLAQVFPRGIWADAVEEATTATLSSGAASWIFRITDRGWSLLSFSRNGSATWVNQERSLWKILVHPVGRWAGVTDRDSLQLEPSRSNLVSWRAGTRSLVATHDVNVYDSVLRVRTVLTADADRLACDVTLSWVTKANDCTVEGVCSLPLLVEPRDRGSDEACLGALKGHVVVDPIPRFRYQPEVSGQPLFGWLAQRRQSGAISAGRATSMAVWGYYSTLDREGWMTWTDTTDRRPAYPIFESDGSRMLFDHWAPVEDWCVVHNGNRTIEAPRVALRPFQASTPHGWWDVAQHYADRLRALNAPWITGPKIMLDPDRAQHERAPHIFAATSEATEEDLDDATEIQGLPDFLRTRLGLPASAPIFGLCYGKSQETRPWIPGHTATEGTVRDGILQAHGALEPKASFYGSQKPAFFFPEPGEAGVWNEGQDTDLWTTKGLLPYLYTSRQGFHDGDTDATRGFENSSTVTEYFRERSYTVASVDPAAKRIVVDSFGGDEWKAGQVFIGVSISFLIGGVVYWAETSSISGTTLTLRDDPRNHLAQAVYPPAGSTVRLHDRTSEFCYHAVAESDLLPYLERHQWEEMQRIYAGCVLYMDVEPQRLVRELCSSAHAGLSGYAPHPRGGGRWIYDARRKLFERMVFAARCGRQPNVALVGGEYLDEAYLPHKCYGLHVIGHTALWRTFESAPNDPDFNDPDDHGMRPVPMFSVAYAGRAYGLQTVFSFGTGILVNFIRNDNTFPVDAPKYRRAQAWWAGGEWVYGLTPPQYVHTYSEQLTTDGATPLSLATADPWDAAQYTGANAAVAEVATVRDYWAGIVEAEQKWILSYLRNGELLQPLTHGGGTTLFDIYTSGIFDRASALLGSVHINFRQDLPVLWDPHNYPRVQHAVWRAVSGSSICVVMTNPTDTAGTLEATLDLSLYGLEGEVHAFRVGTNGIPTPLGESWSTCALSETLAAYSSSAIVLVPESEVESLQLRSDLTDSPPIQVRALSSLTAIIAIEVEVLDGGVPVDVSVALVRQLVGTFPSGASLVAPANNVTDGTDGRIRAFLTAEGFRADPGVWHIGARVNLGAGAVDGSQDQIAQAAP